MKKLTSKDLINIGIFSAIYIGVLVFISGLVITPVLQILMMPVIALFTAPIYLLYIAKVGKFGALTITGLLGSLLVGLLVYGNIYCFLVNFAIFFAAELIAYAGKYKNKKLNNLSFIVASFWVIGEAGLPWVAGKYFWELSLASGYSKEWADGVVALATPTVLVLMIIGTIICGFISIWFSDRMFNKHFKKAGII